MNIDRIQRECDILSVIRTHEEQSTLGLEEKEFSSDPKDWFALGLLMEEIDDEMRQQRKHLLMRLAQWLVAHDVFRKIERRKMIQTDPGARDLEFHNILASSLMGSGKMLLRQLRDHTEIDPKHLGVRFDDLRATVVSVEMDYLQWHGGMTQQRQKQILDDVFGG